MNWFIIPQNNNFYSLCFLILGTIYTKNNFIYESLFSKMEYPMNCFNISLLFSMSV